MQTRKFYDNGIWSGYRSGKEITRSGSVAVVQCRNARGTHSIVLVCVDWDEAIQEDQRAVDLFAKIGKKKQVRKLQAYLANRRKGK